MNHLSKHLDPKASIMAASPRLERSTLGIKILASKS
jgi:hypothetical protein